MKKIVVGVIVLVLLAAAVAVVNWRRGATAKLAADPTPATPVKASRNVTAEATVVPAKSAALAFSAGGLVAEVLIREGDRVQAGQVIARLDQRQRAAAAAAAEAQLQRAAARVSELKAGPRSQEVASARAGLQSAQAQLARVQLGATAADLAAAGAEVRRAEAEVTRAQEALAAAARSGDVRMQLYEQGVAAAQASLAAAQARLSDVQQGPRPEEIAVAAAEARRAQAQLDLVLVGARAETVAAAEADAAAARQSLEQAQAALAETELRAPFAGTVVTLDPTVGEYVAPGIPVVRLADLSRWQVETDDLTEIKATQVREGAPVTVKFDAISGLELSGKVVRVKGRGEKKQGDMTFTAVVELDRQDERLRWNLTASVSIVPSVN